MARSAQTQRPFPTTPGYAQIVTMRTSKAIVSATARKDAVLAELHHERKQRPPGPMFRLAMTTAAGGLTLAPHFAPGGTTVAAEYYAKLLESHTFPQIRLAMSGDAWWWQPDGASPRTEKSTVAFLTQSGAKMIGGEKWPAASARLNPLGFSAHAKMKAELYVSKKRRADTIADLQTSALQVARKFAGDPEWKAQSRKARGEEFWRRCAEIVRNDGKMIIKKQNAKRAP